MQYDWCPDEKKRLGHTQAHREDQVRPGLGQAKERGPQKK